MNSITIKFGSVGLLIWVGLGLLYHIITGDEPFSWGNPWLYVDVALWPFFLFFWVVVTVAVTAGSIYAAIKINKYIEEKRTPLTAAQERMKRHRAKMKEQEEQKRKREQQKTLLPHHRK